MIIFQVITSFLFRIRRLYKLFHTFVEIFKFLLWFKDNCNPTGFQELIVLLYFDLPKTV